MYEKIIRNWLKIPYKLNVYSLRRVRKPSLTILFLHGIGNTGVIWEDTISRLPDSVRYVSLDLLGFGDSPKPREAQYSAHTQARAVWRTYRQLAMGGKVIVVGHSLGSLIAVELARLHPRLVDSLILCSPPFYAPDPEQKQFMPQQDYFLKDIYRQVQKYPERLIKTVALAKKYGIIGKAFDVTDKNIHAYIGALQSSIVNQTSLQDAAELNLPIYIIHGRFDPVVVTQRLTDLAKQRPNVSLKHIVASHDINRRYGEVVAHEVSRLVEERTPKIARSAT